MRSRTTDREWERIETILFEALQLPEGDRESFVVRACADRPDVRKEVLSLMRQHTEEPAFMEDGVDVPAGSSDQRMEGALVGPYRIVRPIAQGGMGEVHLAMRDRADFQQYVAVKLIRGGIREGADLQRRFANERRILASLTHPNIARFLDAGVNEEGVPYFVMEYVDGRPITEYCQRRELPLNARLDLFRAVCDAVSFAHRNLVVHRDIKPSNILVPEAGIPKLLDFGIAKILDQGENGDEVGLTRTHFRLFTPDFAAPEQVRNEAITTATDVYALGVLLYELLADERPYDAGVANPIEMARIVCEVEPAEPSSAIVRNHGRRSGLARRVQGDLDVIVLTALRKDPQRRYATVRQFADDVERFQRGEPVLARADTVAYRLRKFVGRHAIGVASSGVAVLALVGFTLAMMWQSARVQARSEEAIRERDRAREVSEFLVNLFESSDPTHTGGSDVSARDLLDLGARSVEFELEHAPHLQAEMYAVLSRVYASMGLYARAESLAIDAVARRRALVSGDHPELAIGLNSLGVVYYATSRYEDAEATLREALRIRERTRGTEHVEVAEAAHDLAWTLVAMARYEEAAALYERALDIRIRAHGEDHPEVARTLNDMAILHRRGGNLAEADAAHQRALEIRRVAFGEQHRWYAQSLNNLAIVREDRGDHASAETLLTRSVAILTRVLGSDHPDVLLYESNLAKQRYHVGHYAEADSLFRRILAAQQLRLGTTHRDVALTLSDLGQIEQRRGHHDRAEEFFQRALSMRHGLFGPSHPEVAWSMGDLAELSAARGDLAQAETLYHRSLEMLRETVPQNRSMQTRAMLGLGDIFCRTGRSSDGRSLLEEVLAIRRTTQGPEHWRTVEVEAALARCAPSLASSPDPKTGTTAP